MALRKTLRDSFFYAGRFIRYPFRFLKLLVMSSNFMSTSCPGFFRFERASAVCSCDALCLLFCSKPRGCRPNSYPHCFYDFKNCIVLLIKCTSQVGFAELKKTANDRANISGTIIGAPIVGQQLDQYILTDQQDADCRPMITLILSRQL